MEAPRQAGRRASPSPNLIALSPALAEFDREKENGK